MQSELAMLTKILHAVEYIYYYLANLSYMFRQKLQHPQEELLSLAQNYLLTVMLLHWLQSIR